MEIEGEATDRVVVSTIDGLRQVLAGPLTEIAVRTSRFVTRLQPHDVLVIFTRECTGKPRKVSGPRSVVDRITIEELEAIKAQTTYEEPFVGTGTLAGSAYRVVAVLDITNTLLVLRPTRADIAPTDITTLTSLFGVIATSIQHQVTQASPEFLAESRAASSERARTIAELTELHEATLSNILGTLRSHNLDDRRARITASETALNSLISLQTAGAVNRALSEEAVTTAFARLQGELTPMFRTTSVKLEFADPPEDGRPLPGEIAHAARAMVRSVVSALATQEKLVRVRIAWDCDGENVLIEIRDQGAGHLDRGAIDGQISSRLRTLGGQLDVETTPGWGNRVSLTIPLDLPAARPDEQAIAMLKPREREVLAHLALGKRNRAIAVDLGISESTVKFHVANVLKKLDVNSRGEAAAIGMRAGAALT